MFLASRNPTSCVVPARNTRTFDPYAPACPSGDVRRTLSQLPPLKLFRIKRGTLNLAVTTESTSPSSSTSAKTTVRGSGDMHSSRTQPAGGVGVGYDGPKAKRPLPSLSSTLVTPGNV